MEDMGAFEEDGALLITVMIQMQSFRNDFFGAHRLIIECSVPAACILNGGCGCVSLGDALLRLRRRTNSEIYQVHLKWNKG